MSLKITVFSDNYVSMRSRGCWAQHGLGLFIEAMFDDMQLNIIFDAGPSSDIVKHNLDVLNFDLSRVNAIIISHGHHDHTGGLIEIIKRIGKRVPVIIHPKTFSRRFAKRDLRVVGVPFSRTDVENSGGIIVSCRNGFDIAGRIFVTGEIDRINDFEKVEGYIIEEDNKLVDDYIIDDRALIIDLNGEHVLITGCAHSGLINTINYAIKNYGVKKFKAIIGGFHLEGASDEKINRTINELRNVNFECIIPMHCTGVKMTSALINNFGKKVKIISVGESLKI